MLRFQLFSVRFLRFTLAALVVACPLVAANGQTPKTEAAPEPTPSTERTSEMEVPAASPQLTPVVPGDKTLLNYSEPTLQERNLDAIKAEMEAARDELTKAKQLIAEVMKEQKQLAKESELAPLEHPKVSFHLLENIQADIAAQTIESMFGRDRVRVSIDAGNNTLIVACEEGYVDALRNQIDVLEQHADTAAEYRATLSTDPNDDAQRTLMLRIFWLADGVEGYDEPRLFLPAKVIESLTKLGIDNPRLITQTVTALSVARDGSLTNFETNVPAILFDQPVALHGSGIIRAERNEKLAVELSLKVSDDVSLQGSLITPIGHFMVLGTADSVITDDFAGAMEMGGGGRGMGRGEMGLGMAAPAKATYNSSRFAFVVQVVEAESFAPEE